MNRPLCSVCNKNYAAANYWRNGIRHYRSRCESCIRIGKQLLPQRPKWQQDGYRKKMKCDVCGFVAKITAQTQVWHIDGNLNNSELVNLRTVCLNCVEVVKRKNFTWRRGGLEVD
jgi:hypothetical protein